MHSTVGEFRMMKVCVVEVMAGSSNDHTEIDEPPPSIYFGGCGFGCAFFIGAHRAMVERWGVDFHKRTIIAGGSAGAVMAIQVALGRTNDQMHEMYRWTASEALQRGPIQQASACLMEAVTKILESESSNAYKSLSQNNCFISATNFPFEHKFYSRWLDNDDLVACIAASCHIPLYSQRGSGSYADHVDGAYGFSGTALAAELHGNDTLFVGIDPTADVGRSLTQMQMVSHVVFHLLSQLKSWCSSTHWLGKNTMLW